MAEVGEQYRKMTVPAVGPMLERKLADGDEAGRGSRARSCYLADHMHEVPVLVIPATTSSAAHERYGRPARSRARPEQDASRGCAASIYPAVWSFLLALRVRRLGSMLTTAHQLDQPAMAKILGIPDLRGTRRRCCPSPARHRRRLHAVAPSAGGGLDHLEPP